MLPLADSGCDGQAAPQTSDGSVVGLAVRLNLPAIGVYHSCELSLRRCSPGLPQRTLARPPLRRLWSITKIAVPLKRTAVATIRDLSNYQIVFYLDNGVP